jgi:hypothetical protein
MRKTFFTFLMVISILLVFNVTSLSAMTYEVGFSVRNENNQTVSKSIVIRERDGGAWVGNYQSSYSGTYNFHIDLNYTECNKTWQACLDVGKVYVITIDYEGTIGEKSFYYTRDFLQCNPYDNDTYYIVTPSTIGPDENKPNVCEPEDVWDYPNAAVHYPLTLALVDEYFRVVGDKTWFRLKATAGGGDGSYYFTWSGATSITGATANPNKAVRTILKKTTVSVTVTSNGESVTRSITLWPGGL